MNNLLILSENLRSELRRRAELKIRIEKNPFLQKIEKEKCRRNTQYWFDNYVYTYDPRLASQGGMAHIPFIFFQRQREMLVFLENRLTAQEDGLIEKSRDIGFTWEVGGLALHRWLFYDGFKTSIGSRKEEYVDRKGDPDSIFEKIRMIRDKLPRWMMPKGFTLANDNYMRMVNPDNDNVIRGEAGDQMGRGGRSSLYIIDEAAFLEQGDKVDAATSANSDVRIWGSSVNGMGNIFAKKRFGGSLRDDQIFRFHWSDDPRKTPEWAEKKKKTLEPHIWASEYEIDYSASIEGICIPAEYVQAGIELAKHIAAEPSTYGVAGLDVGAGGKGKSVYIARYGAVVLPPKSWGNPDTAETAHKALDETQENIPKRQDGADCKIYALQYDSIGVGQGVQSALRWTRKGNVTSFPINVGDSPTNRKWPDGQSSEEKFVNLKAEAWWIVRTRLKCAYEWLLFLQGKEGGQAHTINDVLLLPPASAGEDAMTLIAQLSLPRWFKTDKGLIIMESKKELAKRGIASPDHAEALILTFCRSNAAEQWASL